MRALLRGGPLTTSTRRHGEHGGHRGFLKCLVRTRHPFLSILLCELCVLRVSVLKSLTSHCNPDFPVLKRAFSATSTGICVGMQCAGSTSTMRPSAGFGEPGMKIE